MNAKAESFQIANLSAADRGNMTDKELYELGGIEESGLSRIIRESRRLLGLHTFYTAGPKGVT